MNQVIIYGSQYGSTYRYAKQLSEQTNITAVSYREAPDLSGMHTIIYMGGLYAGGAVGQTKTLRGFSIQNGKKLLLVTVGLADPNESENRDNIRTSLQKQLSPELIERAKIFHLRGGIDYQKLSFGHRMMMKLLYQSLHRMPPEKQTAENRALIETFGKQVDFTDFSTLEPIIQEIQRGTI